MVNQLIITSQAAKARSLVRHVSAWRLKYLDSQQKVCLGVTNKKPGSKANSFNLLLIYDSNHCFNASANVLSIRICKKLKGVLKVTLQTITIHLLLILITQSYFENWVPSLRSVKPAAETQKNGKRQILKLCNKTDLLIILLFNVQRIHFSLKIHSDPLLIFCKSLPRGLLIIIIPRHSFNRAAVIH